MRVHDALYGAVDVPAWLLPLFRTPELQRLRDVRLINTTSPTCASLSDVRRFTHILGVVRLATRLAGRIASTYSPRDIQRFVASATLHDIGTPAFGHLFEYLLTSLSGWHHETIVASIIRGSYRPERRYHQIYYGNTLRLHQTLDEMKLEPDDVVSTVLGRARLGPLLSGSVDLDNIDNVFRMAFMLGMQPDVALALEFVDAVGVHGEVMTLSARGEEVLPEWLRLRRQIYEFLVYDATTVATQAMLTDALTAALEGRQLGEEHWFFTDEQLLSHLFAWRPTRDIVRRFAVGEYYSWLGTYSFAAPRGSLDLRRPDNRRALAEQLSTVCGVPVSPYVFYDKGSFAKRIEYESESGERRIMGEQSASTIVSLFSPRRAARGDGRATNQILALLADMDVPPQSLRSIAVPDNNEVTSQEKISFGA